MVSPSINKVPANGIKPLMFPLSLIFIPVWRIIATRLLKDGIIINFKVSLPIVSLSSVSSLVNTLANLSSISV